MTPTLLDFGEESTQRAKVVVENVGEAELVIHSLAVEGRDAKAFSLKETPKFPLRLAQGKQLGLQVFFHALQRGEQLAVLHVVCSDRGQRDVVVHLTGMGAAGETLLI